MVLFWKDIKPLGHGALLEEVGHWGGPTLLLVHSLLSDLGGNTSHVLSLQRWAVAPFLSIIIVL